LKHSPAVVLIYGLGMLLLTTMMAASTQVDTSNPDASGQAKVGVIDRDASPAAAQLSEYLRSNSTVEPVADNQAEIERVLTGNLIDTLVIIPEGFGAAFASGPDAKVETATSMSTALSASVTEVINRYLSTAYSVAATHPGIGEAAVFELTDSMLSSGVDSEFIELSAGNFPYLKWLMSFFGALLTMGLMMVTCYIASAFERQPISDRTLVSPLSSNSRGLQVGLAAASVTAIIVVLAILVTLFPPFDGVEFVTHYPLRFAALCLSLVVLAVVCVAIGYLLSRFQLKFASMNVAVATLGMVLGFIGGAWTEGDGGSVMKAVAPFTPVYWFREATDSAMGMSSDTWTALTGSGYLGAVGLLALFAVGIFTVALVIDQVRKPTRSSN
jgi:ABC-2 type transport system permease protein